MTLVDLSSLPGGIYPCGVPRPGAYLTDGTALYRVERLLADNSRGKVLLELEDCASLSIVLCPARPLGALGLRPVIPASTPAQEPFEESPIAIPVVAAS